MRIAITPEIHEVAIARYHETRSGLDGSDEELIVIGIAARVDTGAPLTTRLRREQHCLRPKGYDGC